MLPSVNQWQYILVGSLRLVHYLPQATFKTFLPLFSIAIQRERHGKELTTPQYHGHLQTSHYNIQKDRAQKSENKRKLNCLAMLFSVLQNYY